MTLRAALRNNIYRLFLFSLAAGAAASPAAAGVVAASTVSPSYVASTGGGASYFYPGFTSYAPGSLSGDGRWVLFGSSSQNLIAGQAAVSKSQLYLHDRWNGTTLLVSRSASNPAQGANAITSTGWISRDGRYVGFVSSATDLIAGQVDTNGSADVFLYDTVTDTTTLVSHTTASSVTTGNASSSDLSIAADGTLAFRSGATNLVAGFVNSSPGDDIFAYDPSSGATILVSRSTASPTTTGNKEATDPVISSDGNVVAFLSSATNLVTGQVDTNNAADLFGFDIAAGATFLISHTTAGATTAPAKASYKPVLSADGGYAFFASAVSTGFLAGQTDTNNSADAFLFERSTGNISLVSHTAASLTTAGTSSVTTFSLSIDDLGQKMAFLTYSKLHAGDTDSSADVYVYERSTQVNSLLGYFSGSSSDLPTISADGRLVVFKKAYPVSSWVAGVTDPNVAFDILVYDTTTASYDVASRSAGFVTTANGSSDTPQVSADGSVVAFVSAATDFESPSADYNGWNDLVAYDVVNQASALLSHSDPGLPSGTAGGPSQLISTMNQTLSGDGTRAIFYNKSLNLVAPTAGFVSSQLYLFDGLTAAAYMLNHKNGLPATPSTGYLAGAAISRDGGTVVFASTGTDHTTGITDTNNNYDLFSWDPATGNLSYLVLAAGSSTNAPSSGSVSPSLSADGRYVAFQSSATNLIAGITDSNATADVFWLDRQTGTVRLVSRAASSPTVTANGLAKNPAISADGQWVVFAGSATNHVTGQSDSNSMEDLFLWSAASGNVVLVSHLSTSAVTTLAKLAANPVVSADGGWVAFNTAAVNVVAGITDLNGTTNGDVYLYETATGTNRLVSFRAGFPTQTMSNNSLAPSISDDGAWVSFANRSTTLGNIYLYSRTAGTNTLVSHTAANPSIAGNGDSNLATVAADGSRVVFQSKSTNLITGQVVIGAMDIFRYETATGAISLLSPAYGTTLTGANGSSIVDCSPKISADGTAALYVSDASNLLANDYNNYDDVFIYDDP